MVVKSRVRAPCCGRHSDRRRHRRAQPRPRALHAGRSAGIRMGSRSRPARATSPPSATARGCADRAHPRRQPLPRRAARSPKVENTREGPDPRLRQADLDDRDQRRGRPRGCAGLCRAHPAGPAQRVRQLRGALQGQAAEAIPDLAFNPAFLKKVDELELSVRSASCRRTTTSSTSAIWFRRPRPRCCAPQLRAQVAQRDQGSAGADGPAPRHGSARLAAENIEGWPSASRTTTSNRSSCPADAGHDFGRAQEAHLSNVRRTVATQRREGLSGASRGFTASSTARRSIARRCSATCARR